MRVKKIKKSSEQKEFLQQKVKEIIWPSKFKLPLSPKLEVKGIIPEKCKVMDSAKKPLWLVFKNADETGKDVYIIFKAGDDLRQDLLTLQILGIMDKLWFVHSIILGKRTTWIFI
jgi:phosphatidylinositol kinase/protein kinase (PI-3  family)